MKGAVGAARQLGGRMTRISTAFYLLLAATAAFADITPDPPPEPPATAVPAPLGAALGFGAAAVLLGFAWDRRRRRADGHA